MIADFFFNFNLFVLYWGISDWQCCDSFRWTAKGHVPILPQTSFPARLPHNIEQSSFCYTEGPRIYVSERESCSVVSDSLWTRELYSPWNSPGQNTGVGSISLLQGIFPTQGLNSGLPYSLPLQTYRYMGSFILFSRKLFSWVIG